MTQMNYKSYTISEMMKLPSSQSAKFKYEDKPKDIVKMVHKKIKSYSAHWKKQHEKMDEAIKMLSDDAWDESKRQERDFLKKPSGNFPMLQGFRDNVYHSSMIPSLTVRITAKDLKGEDTTGTTTQFSSDDGDTKFTTAQFYQGFVNSILYSSKCADHFNEVLARAIDYGYGGYLLMYVDKVDEFSDDDELEIKFTHNINPYSFLMDPTTRAPDHSDMNFFIDYNVISKMEAQAIYGKKACFESATNSATNDNIDETLPEYMKDPAEDMVKIIDVWERRKIRKQVVRLADGKYMFYDDYVEVQAELQAQNNPAVGSIATKDFWQVRKYCICKDELLGKAEIIPGFNKIPVYPMFGKSYDVKSKKGFFGKRYRGLTELAHDLQTALNVVMSNIIDKAGRNTNNMYQMPGGSVNDINQAKKKLQASGPDIIKTPKNSPIVPVSEGNVGQEDVTLLQVIPELMRDVIGMSSAAIGRRSNEISERALKAQKQQSDSGLLIYPRQSAMVVRRMAEDIITNARLIYKKNRRVIVDDENGKPVAVTIGKATMHESESGVVKSFDNDIDRDPKLDVVVEHNIHEESRRDQFNQIISEISQKTNDPSIQSICAAMMVKNSGAPGAARVASKILRAMKNIELLTPDELEQKVRDENEMAQRIEKLNQEGLNTDMYNPEKQKPPPEVQIEQMKLQQEQVKLQVAQINAQKEAQLAGVELKTAEANADGQEAAARQKMAAADKTRAEITKERISADKSLAELEMKLNKESEDMQTNIKKEIVNILKEYFETGQIPETQ